MLFFCMKEILSNIGFVLQMSGIFTLIPIIISFAYQESGATIALFITATAFFALGFVLNSLCERKALSYKQSCCLIVLVFILLSFIGAIPYLYINASDGGIFTRITDSIFESASGFTTTGFSVLPNVDALPRSIVFYRALTQFIGGIGIVLLLLVFFYPEEKLKSFSKSMGLPENYKIKKTFLLILVVYFVYCIAMALIAFFMGYKDILMLLSYLFSALSTGGFGPTNDITAHVTASPLNYILIISMILGAVNFIVLAGIFKLRIKEFLKSEIILFIVILSIAVIELTAVFGMDFFDGLFHGVSAMTTTGFGYLPLGNASEGIKILLTALMFVGGTSFSTAGGIKVYRLVLFFKAMQKAVAESLQHDNFPITVFGKQYTNPEVLQGLMMILIMIFSVGLSSLILVKYGYAGIDAVFESTSALATTGLSVGIVGPALASELKWLFIFLMILGRVEIFAFLIMISGIKELPQVIEVPLEKLHLKKPTAPERPDGNLENRQ